jgi:hypothetical protein
MATRIPVQVEVLERGGWSMLGEYSITRARKLARLLRQEGKVIRTDAETVKLARIGWITSVQDGTQLGSVDGLDIFIVTPNPVGTDWLVYTRLPGHADKPVQAETEDEAKIMAEEILDAFVRRMGVSVR